MKIIDCSFYSDGQGPFKNGMHDAFARIRRTHNLYRPGFDGARMNRFFWTLGWWFQKLTGAGYVIQLRYVERNGMRHK